MYAKVFSSMYDGTLATKGPWQALVTFQQLLVLADRFGVVDMTTEAVSRRTTIPLEIIQQGIRELQEPDSSSRSPDEEGRRIVLLDEHREWGWRIVNYAKYRQIQRHEERREYMRDFMEKKRAGVSTVSHVSARKPKKPIADADADADAEQREQKHLVKSKAPKFRSDAQAAAFAEFWDLYPRKTAKLAAERAYIKKITSTKRHKTVMDALSAQLAGLLGREPEHRPHPATWLNGERWGDDPGLPAVPKPEKEKFLC